MNHGELRRYFEEQLDPSLDFLRRMVEVNSYTLNPEGTRRVGEIVAESFAELGFSSWTHPSAYKGFGEHFVLRRQGSGKRQLVMVSHLDTVFPKEEEERNNFHWRRDGDRIYGPGIIDIKGGTMMMRMTLGALREFAPERFDEVDFLILLNSSEEMASPDFGQLAQTLIRPDALAILVFEAEGERDGVRRLVRSRKGRAVFEVKAEGRSAHAGVQHKRGANAIVELSRVIERIASFTDYEKELTFNPGIVSGGVSSNRVPHEAKVEVEMRALEPDAYEHGLNQMLGLNGTSSVVSAEGGYACRVRVNLVSETPPWPRNEATDGLLSHWTACAEELGRALGSEDRGGVSDGNYMWRLAPSVDGLGPYGDNDHCSEQSDDGSKEQEYMLVSSVVPKAMINAVAMERMVGVKSEERGK